MRQGTKGMIPSEAEVREMVRRVVLRTLGVERSTQASDPGRRTIDDGPANPAVDGKAAGPPRAKATTRPFVGEVDVLAIPRRGRLALPEGTRLTPLAADAVLERRLEVVRAVDAPPVQEPRRSPAMPSRPAAGSLAAEAKRAVALGSDHGGYALKEELKRYLTELGYPLLDCGTHSTAAVDYPDLAYAVARLVAEGRAWRGIVVDGAGIGSCMAANKVPGVRAALCYDHATAVNSREHNDANVLTLGGSLIGVGLAREIVRTWLETPFGGGRHARRVDKIMEIEQRYWGGSAADLRLAQEAKALSEE